MVCLRKGSGAGKRNPPCENKKNGRKEEVKKLCEERITVNAEEAVIKENQRGL